MRTGRVALLVVLALMLSSCQEGAEESAATPTPGDNLQAYCDAKLKLETARGRQPDIEEEPPSERQAKEKQFFADELLPLAKEVRANAPSEIEDDIEGMYEEIETLAEGGEPAGEGPPEEGPPEEGPERVPAFDHEHCGWRTVDVTATEYAFEGIPKTLERGVVSFKLTNEGKEDHDMVIYPIDDDVTEPFLEIVEEESSRGGRFVNLKPLGGMLAKPGKSGYAVFDLEAGRYGVVCWVPVGGGESEERADDQPVEGERPVHHWERGMLAEFTVT